MTALQTPKAGRGVEHGQGAPDRSPRRPCGLRPSQLPHLATPAKKDYSGRERLARASASPTRSGPEGSSRNEPRSGRRPASHPSPLGAPAREVVVVRLRKTLPIPLDDLRAVVREILDPGVSRSGPDRCLLRHGLINPCAPMARTRAVRGLRARHQTCRRERPAADDRRDPAARSLFAVIDRATRWLVVRLGKAKTDTHAGRRPRVIWSGPSPCASE